MDCAHLTGAFEMGDPFISSSVLTSNGISCHLGNSPNRY